MPRGDRRAAKGIQCIWFCHKCGGPSCRAMFSWWWLLQVKAERDELKQQLLETLQAEDTPSAGLLAGFASPETLGAAPESSESATSTLNSDAILARKLQRQYDQEREVASDAAPPEEAAPSFIPPSLPDKPSISSGSKWKIAARRAIQKNGFKPGGAGGLSPESLGDAPAGEAKKVRGIAGIALAAREAAGRGVSGQGKILAPVNENRLLNDQKVYDFLGEMCEYLWREQA